MMRFLLSAFFLLVASVPQAALSAALLFEEDFEDDSVDGLSLAHSDWAIASDPTEGKVLDNNRSAYAGGALFNQIDTVDTPAHFRLTARLKIENGSGSRNYLGFYWNRVGSSATASMLQLQDDANSPGYYDFEFGRPAPASPPPYEDAILGTAIDHTAWYDFTLEVDQIAGAISYRLTDVGTTIDLVSTTVPTAQFAAINGGPAGSALGGAIGFNTWQTPVLFDSIQLFDMDAIPAPTALSLLALGLTVSAMRRR